MARGAMLSGVIDLSLDALPCSLNPEGSGDRPTIAEIREGHKMAKTLSMNAWLQPPRSTPSQPTTPSDFVPEVKRTLKRTVEGILKEAQANGQYTDYRLDASVARSQGASTTPEREPLTSHQNGTFAGPSKSKDGLRDEGRTTIGALLRTKQPDMDHEDQQGPGARRPTTYADGEPGPSNRATPMDSISAHFLPVEPTLSNFHRAPTVQSSSELHSGAETGSREASPNNPLSSAARHPDMHADRQPSEQEEERQDIALALRSPSHDFAMAIDSDAEEDDIRMRYTFRTTRSTAPGAALLHSQHPAPAAPGSAALAKIHLIRHFARLGLRKHRQVRALFGLSPIRKRPRRHFSQRVWTGPPAGAEVIEILDDESISPTPRATQPQTVPGALTPALIAEKPTWAKRPHCAKGSPLTPQERRKLIELRLFHHLTFAEIATWFPGRHTNTVGTLWNKTFEPHLEKYLTEAEMAEYVPGVIASLNGRHIAIPAAYRPYSFRNARVEARPQDAVPSAPRPRGRPRKVADRVAEKQSRGSESSPANNASSDLEVSARARPRRAVVRPQDYYAVPAGHRDEPAAVSEDREQSDTPVPAVSRVEQARSIAKRLRRKHKTEPQANPRPYLAFNERRALREGFADQSWDEAWLPVWRGAPLHVDFAPAELFEVRRAIKHVKGTTNQPDKDVLDLIQGATDAELERIFWELQSGERLPTRTREDVQAFFSDLHERLVNTRPSEWQLAGSSKAGLVPNALLRSRELGGTRVQARLRDVMLDQLQPSRHFEKTSGDVGSVAWAPDGTTFACGAMALVDPASMQYNLPNNLLIGNADEGNIQELPAHFTRRELQEEGPNSTREMLVTQDPRLFSTVSQVAYSSDGKLMYSAGYDGTVCCWEVESSRPRLADRVHHGAPVDLLAVKPGLKHSDPHVVATACQVLDGSVKVLSYQHKLSAKIEFSSKQARLKREARLFPSALRWGVHSSVSGFLLAGFASNRTDDQGGQERLGALALWDTQHGSQEPIKVMSNPLNVFDIAWSPHGPFFAVACVAGNDRGNRSMRSEVKLYAPKDGSSFSSRMQLECPASDINDVAFSPYDAYLVSVGCTDGSVYMWDTRRPGDILHKLSHGNPLQTLIYDNERQREREREKVDTGVRFLSWGHVRDRLYTGSSDGIVTSWDPYRSTQDARHRDVVQLQSGVMSGAFNADYTKLLLGSVNGRIDILEVGSDKTSTRKSTPLRKLATEASEASRHIAAAEDPDSGIASARALLDSQAISIERAGAFHFKQAVQGPNYASTNLFDHGHKDDKEDNNPHTRRAQASMLQSQLRGQVLDPCTIPLCRESWNAPGITEEYSGDSGRSADRIPHALRVPSSAEDSDGALSIVKYTIGMPKCASCGRPARPSLDMTSPGNDNPLRCERCAFGCIRCGQSLRLSAKHIDSDMVECFDCGCIWRADILGYRLIFDLKSSMSSMTEAKQRTPQWQRRTKRWARELTKLRDAIGYDDELSTFERETLREQDTYFNDEVYGRFDVVVDPRFQ